MFDKYLTKTGRISCKQPTEIKTWWYIKKFQEVHGDAYDYSKVEYKGYSHKVEILCREHGSFFQRHSDHLNGQGCPTCQKNQPKSIEQCILDFRKIHNSTYDYSRVQYTTSYTKVEIICKEHGSFFQRPNHHLRGVGCPKCQNQNQDTLYLLKCLETGLIKIGITSNLKSRIYSIGGDMEIIRSYTLTNPRHYETILHKKYQSYNKFNHTVISGGTEFFNLTNQQIQEIDRYVRSI